MTEMELHRLVDELPEESPERRVGDGRIIFGPRDSERVIDVIAVRPRGRAYR